MGEFGESGNEHQPDMNINLCIIMYMNNYVYVYMYICIYVYMYIGIYMYICGERISKNF